jgi:multidrug resistance efflux pump
VTRLAVLGLGLGLAACADPPPPAALVAAGAAPVARPTAEPSARQERLLLTGRIRAASSVELTAPRTRMWNVSLRWLGEDGAIAKKGERVAELDNSAFTGDLEEKRLVVRQAALDFAIGAAVAARATADKKFEVEKRKLLLAKARLLAGVPKDLLSARTFEERQLELERARVAVGTAESDLATHEKTSALDLEVKRIALEKAERGIRETDESLAALVLLAPRDGLIVVADHPWERRKMQLGDTLQPGWTIVEMPDVATMEVQALLSDVDDGRVRVGDRAVCTLDAHPDHPFEGTVKEISPVAREPGRFSMRRAFDVKIVLDQSDPTRMRPGMSVKVELRQVKP